MNAMAWVKGSNLDYDGWNVHGRSWDDVEPVFARMEREAIVVGRIIILTNLSDPSSPRHARVGVAAVQTTSEGLNSTSRRSLPVTIYNGERWNVTRGYLNIGRI